MSFPWLHSIARAPAPSLGDMAQRKINSEHKHIDLGQHISNSQTNAD